MDRSDSRVCVFRRWSSSSFSASMALLVLLYDRGEHAAIQTLEGRRGKHLLCTIYVLSTLSDTAHLPASVLAVWLFYLLALPHLLLVLFCRLHHRSPELRCLPTSHWFRPPEAQKRTGERKSKVRVIPPSSLSPWMSHLWAPFSLTIGPTGQPLSCSRSHWAPVTLLPPLAPQLQQWYWFLTVVSPTGAFVTVPSISLLNIIVFASEMKCKNVDQ